jgi:hypothetical protein
METVTIQLYKARDAEEAYAIRRPEPENWLARSGFGSQFEPVWTVEFQGSFSSEPVDWQSVMDRAIEAYRLSDPIVTNFQWPGLVDHGPARASE